MHLLVLVEILGKHLLHHHGFPQIDTSNWGPHAICMYKTNINIFHNKYLSKAVKILQWQFFWSICDTSFNLPPYANYTVCCLHCQRWDHYSWPQQACPRDGGRPGDAQVQSAIAEKHVYCVKNLLALPCLTSIWYSIYMYLPRQTSFDLRKQHLDFRLLVLVLRCLLNPIHRLLVFVSLSFCFSVFSPVCLS